ncbi:MAG: hypothetical protein HY040_22850, partial [Planctomycetes bacterium]|nr:hypothetical protein [Planctomycetota bacterium]
MSACRPFVHVRMPVRVLLGGLLLAAALPAVAAAQYAPGSPMGPPASSQLPKIHYTRSSTFTLPVNMPEKAKANVSEICLYVKTGAGDWVRHEVAPPTIECFTFKAPRDGEYWFSLVTVDKAGKAAPTDVRLEPPSLRVLIDTQPPAIEVQAGVTV